MSSMPRKLVLLLLSAVLLLQCCENVSAKPTPESDTAAEESQELEASYRDRLLIFSLTEFAIIGKFTIIQGKNILKNVTKDAEVLKATGELLQPHFDNFTKYIEKVEKFEQRTPDANDDRITTLFELVIDFADIAEKYNTTALKEPTAEDRLIEVSLKKNGLDQLEQEFGDRFLEFSREFDTVIPKYFDSLTSKERENESKMVEWYKKFKAEQDVEKKVEIFSKFFELYA